MTRTRARELAMHCIFSLDFVNLRPEELLAERLTPAFFEEWAAEEPLYETLPVKKMAEYLKTLVQGVYLHGPELDEYISRYAEGWKFDRIPRTAIAIMRVAMYEVLYMPSVPNKVAINEAVEISKSYEDEKTVSFVNGILGSFLRGELPEGEA